MFDVTAGGDVVLRLHVQPGAGRTAVAGKHGDALKVRVAAPPEGGRANEAVIALVAETLGVAKDAVSLTSGESSRSKRVKISGVDADDATRLLHEALAAGAERPSRKSTGRELQGPRIR
ncbi:MAG: DUF167 domain-containing protein [Actinobacteria bacterium]|nr:DUF167 domain-containing protein [Actinomycetota bacterium]